MTRSLSPVRLSCAKAFFALPILVSSALAGCGGGGSSPSGGFIAHFPSDAPGEAPPPIVVVPPPTFPIAPVWNPAAVSLSRTALYGSFPSDIAAFGSTLFVSDADAIEAAGADILPFATGGSVPAPSQSFARVHIRAADLVDSHGNPGDAAHPIAFGAFLNDLSIANEHLGFVLVNAGGSDSAPTLSNVVVFDPTSGALRQTVDLALAYHAPAGAATMLDSTGVAVPGQAFVQSGAEGVAYVPTGPSKGLLFVAMANLVIGGPSFGATKYPGTVEVFDVDESKPAPIAPRPGAGLATETLTTVAYNPAAVTPFASTSGIVRLLVTSAGTTGYDPSFKLVPQTPAAVEVLDCATRNRLGLFDLGLVGLSSARPALGFDAAGHHIAALASSVLGEVYLLRTDGIYTDTVDPSRVEVLRGAQNGIPIEPAAAGAPGGNVAGLAISPDGRTLLASGFGDFFAFPTPKPGRLFVIALPHDVVGSPLFPVNFVSGTTELVTAPGSTLGPIVVLPSAYGDPEVFTAVSGSLDPTSFLGTGPATIGTLTTFGAIR